MSVISLSDSESSSSSDIEFVRASLPSRARSRSPRPQPWRFPVEISAEDHEEVLYEVLGNMNLLRHLLDTYSGNLRFPNVPNSRRRRFMPSDLSSSSARPADFLSGVAVERIESKTAAEELGSCPICLADYKLRMTVRVLSCGHKIHKPCFDAWIRKGRFTCPLDNTKLHPPLQVKPSDGHR
jgi:hypothetical protein